MKRSKSSLKSYDSGTSEIGIINRLKHRVVESFFMVVEMSKNVCHHGWLMAKIFKIKLAKMP